MYFSSRVTGPLISFKDLRWEVILLSLHICLKRHRQWTHFQMSALVDESWDGSESNASTWDFISH